MVPKILFVAEIALRVENLEKMKTFYQEVMGFTMEIEEDNHVFLKIADIPSPLGEINHPQIFALFDRNAPPDIQRTSLDHLAFEVLPEDYDDTREKFIAAEMVIRERKWPDTLPWRGRSFFFYDPEGNVIEIITANQPSKQIRVP